MTILLPLFKECDTEGIVPRQGKIYLFSVVYPTDEHYAFIDKLGESVAYLAYGRFSVDLTTPFLKGIVVFKGRKRVSTFRRSSPIGFRFEPKIGVSTRSAVESCKEGELFKEFGEFPRSDYRTPLDRFCKWVVSFGQEQGRAPTLEEVSTTWPRLYLWYGKDLHSCAKTFHTKALSQDDVI